MPARSAHGRRASWRRAAFDITVGTGPGTCLPIREALEVYLVLDSDIQVSISDHRHGGRTGEAQDARDQQIHSPQQAAGEIQAYRECPVTHRSMCDANHQLVDQVSYWLDYYVLQQILSKQLHTADDETQAYALCLMDKLERCKAENAANDAIVDDLAAKAYIENFALETFKRGDDAQRANKVTKQTADTFQAAATFLDLLSIWGALEAEIAAKSKFAKFHALRIAKAIKAGEDPNATNPVIEEPKPAEQTDEDGIEQELKELEQQPGTGSERYRPPTVESVADSGPPSLPDHVPQAAVHQEHDVSPIEPPESTTHGRSSSIGGGYFPTLPSAPADTTMPDAQADLTDIAHQPPPASMHAAHSFYSALQQPAAPPSSLIDASAPGLGDPSQLPPPTHMPAPGPSIPPAASPAAFHHPHAPVQPSIPAVASPPIVTPVQPPPAPATVQAPPPGGYRTDDESVMEAQKHAKWAISALHFEDVNTAVKELRVALQALGAS
jgi:vacuolar protein sorting-associated protein VTA1